MGISPLALALACTLALVLLVLQIANLRVLGMVLEALDPALRFKSTESPVKAGLPLPPIPLFNSDKTPVSLDQFEQHGLLMLLVRPDSPMSQALLRDLVTGHLEINEAMHVLVVTQGSTVDARELERQLPNRKIDIWVDWTKGAQRRWGLRSFPTALLIDAHGVLRYSITAPTAEQMRELARTSPSRSKEDSVASMASKAEVRSGVSRA